MQINDSIEHDSEHFTQIYVRAVEAVLRIRKGNDGAGESLIEDSDCDLCMGFALAKIAAALGEEKQIATAGTFALREILALTALDLRLLLTADQN